MGNPEEPQHQRFEGICRDCGCDVVYHSAGRNHPDHIRCDTCEKAWIAKKLTGLETIDGAAVKGSG